MISLFALRFVLPRIHPTATIDIERGSETTYHHHRFCVIVAFTCNELFLFIFSYLIICHYQPVMLVPTNLPATLLDLRVQVDALIDVDSLPEPSVVLPSPVEYANLN